MSNSWNDFKQLNTLSIRFANSLSKQATIFANGNNQVEILVTVKMTGTEGIPLKISQEQLQKALYLCDYYTGRKISAPWIVSFEEGKYNRQYPIRMLPWKNQSSLLLKSRMMMEIYNFVCHANRTGIIV